MNEPQPRREFVMGATAYGLGNLIALWSFNLANDLFSSYPDLSALIWRYLVVFVFVWNIPAMIATWRLAVLFWGMLRDTAHKEDAS